jgi:hypothetical protein
MKRKKKGETSPYIGLGKQMNIITETESKEWTATKPGRQDQAMPHLIPQSGPVIRTLARSGDWNSLFSEMKTNQKKKTPTPYRLILKKNSRAFTSF